MGIPKSEVGYTSAMPRRKDHEVHKDMWGHWGGGNTIAVSVTHSQHRGQRLLHCSYSNDAADFAVVPSVVGLLLPLGKAPHTICCSTTIVACK